MKFIVETWDINKLIQLIESDFLNLKPPFQRNFIWSPKDQVELIESIKSNNPLPSFFLFKHESGNLDMVDGQQRTRTIFRYYKGVISDKYRKPYSIEDQPGFLTYKISVTIITELDQNDSLEVFYSRVNKTGKRLNDAELNKAEFYHTNFLSLVEELTEDQRLKDLDLFRDITIVRMNDRDFVEELITLIKFGLTDKKIARDRLFRDDIKLEEKDSLKNSFNIVFDKIVHLDTIERINKTRFRQKNDFYTLFSLIFFHSDVSMSTLEYLYKIMILLGQHISPSNEISDVLREYAINCVSQSNSKNAREKRLQIWEEILLNKMEKPTISQLDVANFIRIVCGIENVNIIKIQDFYTFDLAQINVLDEGKAEIL
jgi:hypothetical protein